MGIKLKGDKHDLTNRVQDEAARRAGLVGSPEDRHRMLMQEARRVHGISSGSAAAGPRVLSPEQVEHERLVLIEISSGAVAADLNAYNGPDPRRKLVRVVRGPHFFLLCLVKGILWSSNFSPRLFWLRFSPLWAAP